LWVCSDSVFVNDFWFRSSLCALKISGCAATPFSSMIFDSAVVYV
jgi:hypothetical protein